jgi:hypothetical protein
LIEPVVTETNKIPIEAGPATDESGTDRAADRSDDHVAALFKLTPTQRNLIAEVWSWQGRNYGRYRLVAHQKTMDNLMECEQISPSSNDDLGSPWVSPSGDAFVSPDQIRETIPGLGIAVETAEWAKLHRETAGTHGFHAFVDGVELFHRRLCSRKRFLFGTNGLPVNLPPMATVFPNLKLGKRRNQRYSRLIRLERLW